MGLARHDCANGPFVSMKSGLGDRNNRAAAAAQSATLASVSMKSGLGDRNNYDRYRLVAPSNKRLNEVRSWRPEQSRSAGQKKVGLTASQ